MKVFIFSEGDDIGGVGIAIKRAFDRHGGDWEVRAMRGSNNYIDYPVDLSWDLERFKELWAWADVIHAMEKVENLLGIFDPPGKPIVVHHHGTVYRDMHLTWYPFIDEHPLIQVVSTPDLTLYDPRTIWLPNPIDLTWMEHVRSTFRPSDQHQFQVVHTPSQRWAKYTDTFLESYAWFKKQHPTELLLVEASSWATSITQKAKAHLSYDQVRDGYGLSGIEAGAMGIPVMAGYASAETREAVLPLLGGSFPFVEANLSNLGETMLELATNPNRYREEAERGETFVRKYHDERRIVRKLKSIWTRALDSFIDDGEPWL